MEKKNNDKKIILSIIVATYNPKIEKLFFTLDSIMNQKKVYFEVIVTDDGSKDNLFSEINEYMHKKNFKNYQLISHKVNQGTVLNIYDGLKIAKGKFVKLISPGDAINGEIELHEWVNFLEKSNNMWSFCNSIYYSKNENDQFKIYKIPASPQNIKVYKKHKELDCQWNYLIHDDLVLGAATLCRTDIFLKYMKKIKYKVIYAEDNCYRLMMFDGIVPLFYDKSVVLYEYGYGISTSKNDVWGKKLLLDWKATNDIMINTINKNNFQIKVCKKYMYREKNKGINRKILALFEKGKIRMIFRRKILKRMSSQGFINRKKGKNASS